MLTYLYQIDLFNVSTVHVRQPIMRDTTLGYYTWNISHESGRLMSHQIHVLSEKILI